MFDHRQPRRRNFNPRPGIRSELRNGGWPLLFSLCLIGVVLACETPVESPSPAWEKPDPSATEPLEVVGRVLDLQLEFMRAGDALPYEERRDRLAELSGNDFDLPGMARMSYGAGWSQLRRIDQGLWIDVFRRLHVSSRARLRLRDRGQEFLLTGHRFLAEDLVIVETEVIYPKRNFKVFIHYRLARMDGIWRIIDRHSPPSVSEVAMRRAEYRTVLEKKGFGGLLADMESRIQAPVSRRGVWPVRR